MNEIRNAFPATEQERAPVQIVDAINLTKADILAACITVAVCLLFNSGLVSTR